MNANRPTARRLAGEVDPPPLSLDFLPRWTSHTGVHVESGSAVAIDVGSERTTLSDPELAALVGSLVPQLNGHHGISRVAELVREPPERLTEVLQILFELGAIEGASPLALPAQSFFRHMATLGKRWMERELAGVLPTEKLHRRLLLGKLVENYHFVSSAASHIAAAIQQAPSERVRLLLAEYCADEHWHGLMLREGLERAGLGDHVIADAQPLPGTLGVIHFLCYTAQTDFYGYCACSAVCETASNIDNMAEVAQQYWAQISATGLLGDDALRPFREHHLLDAGADHGSIFIEPFIDLSTVGIFDQARIRRTVRRLTASWGEAMRSVERFYGEPAGPDVFSFSEANAARAADC